jgi:hypothetical protein
VLGTFASLDIALQSVPHLLQTTTHRDTADGVPRTGQLRRDRARRLARPFQRNEPGVA